jgi:hypothetical protein
LHTASEGLGAKEVSSHLLQHNFFMPKFPYTCKSSLIQQWQYLKFFLLILYVAGSCIIPPDSVLLFDVEFIGKA